jgi:hypothetical protein
MCALRLPTARAVHTPRTAHYYTTHDGRTFHAGKPSTSGGHFCAPAPSAAHSMYGSAAAPSVPKRARCGGAGVRGCRGAGVQGCRGAKARRCGRAVVQGCGVWQVRRCAGRGGSQVGPGGGAKGWDQGVGPRGGAKVWEPPAAGSTCTSRLRRRRRRSASGASRAAPARASTAR